MNASKTKVKTALNSDVQCIAISWLTRRACSSLLSVP